jgi:RNA polymerase sigma-70 factor (sigma-E family)
VVNVDQCDGDFTSYAETAWQQLWPQAFMLCDDRYEADDLVQDTLSVVFHKWALLARHDALGGYQRTVLTRLFQSSHRRLRWRREVSFSAMPQVGEGGGDGADLRVSLLAAVDRLPPGQRAVIMLRYWGDLSIEQAAAALGVSPGTVASQASKALAALRESCADLR